MNLSGNLSGETSIFLVIKWLMKIFSILTESKLALSLFL